jgi:CRP/FNR family transcriptional regulator, cyclic AMP receptor protein
VWKGQTGRPLVRLLEADPELARGLRGGESRSATLSLLAELVALDAGHYPGDERALVRRPDVVGLLVLSGIVARTVSAHGSASVELLGSGDVLCSQGGEDAEAVDAELVLLRPTRFAVLDQALFAQVGNWPEVAANLLVRASGRSHRLSLQLAISHMVGLERRILALLWHLAYRWGSVTADGVLLPLRLTNRQIGNIVGASDPSVSSAVANLARQGRMRRMRAGTWLPLADRPDLAGGEAYGGREAAPTVRARAATGAVAGS